MQHSILFTFSRRAIAVGCVTLLAGKVQAVELGELTVRSFIGQPLVADIELTALAADEAAGLQVRLASPDVYRGANIGMNPVLASLHLSVVRRDQLQFLHITSLQAVDANYIHLFLTLNEGGRRVVRGATLWLSADPHPAPAPILAPLSAPLVTPTSAMAALNSSPPTGSSRRTPHGVPFERFRPQPKPRPERACAPQSSQAAQACAALNAENTALSSKIVELEVKVKVLQIAFGPRPEAAPVLPTAGAKVALKEPAPIKLIAGIAGALLLVGLGGYFFLRRKNAKTRSGRPGYRVWLDKLFMRKGNAAPQPPAGASVATAGAPAGAED